MLILAAAACCLLSGAVHAADGVALAHANVTVGDVRRVQTDERGRFWLRVDAGRYTIEASTPGFVTANVGPVVVDRDDVLDITLEPLDTPHLRVIGDVRVNGATAPTRNVVPATNVTRSHADASGEARVVDALEEVPSVTFARPDGGGSAAPYVVALRGPDPSETLIAIDGQLLNDANTGDLDVGQFPFAAFTNVSITEGLGPSDLEGSNTIGGAINLISLRPTHDAHAAASYSFGSFGRSEGWLNATGTASRFGYAFAVDDANQHGDVDQDVALCSAPAPAAPCSLTAPAHLGSTIASRAALANLSYAFSQSTDVGMRIFALGNARDLSASESAPVDPSQQGTGELFTGSGNATFAQTVRAYDLHGRAPLGAGSLVLDASVSNNRVNYIGAGTSRYDIAHQDRRETVSARWERSAENGDFAIGGYVRHESLAGSGIASPQDQHIASYFARGAFEPAARVRVEAGIYGSQYSTFGPSLDGRFGVLLAPSQNDSIRASVGTGFRAPLLIERYVFPIGDLPQDVNGIYVGQGNPNEKAEHATEYEVGYGHRFNTNTSVDVTFYRTNLRDPIENDYPLGAQCPPVGNSPGCPLFEYPINVGNVVYQGGELKAVHRFGAVSVEGRYGINVAFPFNLPATVSNPTSGGTLVPYQQFLGIPQQQAGVTLDYTSPTWHAGGGISYRGHNNELNQGPFTVVNAGVGRRFGDVDVTLSGTNLTNAAAGKFTLLGQGEAYNGIGGAIPTDRFVLEPVALRLAFTLRR